MVTEDFQPIRFLGQPIVVEFDEPPAFEKRPDCPDRFIWDGQTYQVTELLSEWRDYGRRGRMATNMRPEHAAAAEGRGSWGVGRFYFRLRTDTGQIFDIYYDRAPGKAGARKGAWFLFRELRPLSEELRPPAEPRGFLPGIDTTGDRESEGNHRDG